MSEKELSITSDARKFKMRPTEDATKEKLKAMSARYEKALQDGKAFRESEKRKYGRVPVGLEE
ncbi:MAG: hypothetical protein HZB23_00015 [Deltaproteobacteria bacterium]|nr:hypothetical protein [Deltaproteobacteria bacterium]